MLPLIGYLEWAWAHARLWTPQLFFLGEGVGHLYSTYMFLGVSGHTGGSGWGWGRGVVELWAGSVHDIVCSPAGLAAVAYTCAVPQNYTAHWLPCPWPQTARGPNSDTFVIVRKDYLSPI